MFGGAERYRGGDGVPQQVYHQPDCQRFSLFGGDGGGFQGHEGCRSAGADAQPGSLQGERRPGGEGGPARGCGAGPPLPLLRDGQRRQPESLQRGRAIRPRPVWLLPSVTPTEQPLVLNLP